MKKRLKSILHCHSENSRYDSTMSVKDMCNKAKELGYEALTLTDHGTLTAIDDFVSAAKDVGIRPIPGVEVYMQDNSNVLDSRFHLVLLAVDDLGYQCITKIVSESNRHIDEKGYPRVTKEILEKYCAKKPYHGHIIATSACVGGVLAGILISPLSLDKEISKLKKKQSKYEDPSSEEHKKNLKAFADKIEKLEEQKKIKNELKALSKKPYKKKEKAVEKLKGTEEYEEALAKLEAEKAESEAAKERLEDINVSIAVLQRDKTSINGRIKDSEKSHNRFNEFQSKIDEIESSKLPFDKLYEMAKEEALYYDELFGHNNFYIEIQYHGYLGDNGEPIEEASFKHLAKMAQELNIPIAAGQDAHMVDSSKESIRARQIIRSLPYAKNSFVFSVSEGDKQLHLKDEHDFKKALSYVLTESEVETAIQNTYEICSRCECSFEYGTHYPKYTQLPLGETADSLLRKMAYEKINSRYPESEMWTAVHKERLEYELSVIAQMGYSDYFLIVQDFLNFGRKLGYLTKENVKYLTQNIKSLTLKEFVDFVDAHNEVPGFVIGPGRGSAAGSIVAYLVGITDIDPIKYDLLFERFLNKDRVSMPDIDSDFGREIRDLVVEYCKMLYGVETVANIVTKGYIAPRGAIRNAGRIIGVEKEQQDYYKVLNDRIAKMVPNEVGINFAKCEELLRQPFIPDERDDSKSKKWKSNANELIDQAKMIEGAFLNYGMHAAGVIIADGNPIDDYVPLMLDEKSGDMKVQCDMVQAEETHGLLKFDFLGLRTLDIITEAIRTIYKNTGRIIDVLKIPFDSKVFKYIFATGKTGCVFQFESAGMRQMLRESRPDNFEDLIALVSLYRPGPMDYIPLYIDNKTHPESIVYLCPELKPILKKTYGVIVYQEQVMEIFQKLAGYSLSQADNVRRFMSKKKMDKLVHERESFIDGDFERAIDGCLKRGISLEVANEIFDQMVEFAKYAFNKSHAAAYSLVAYITAYLKYYYPVEYMCEALNFIEKIADIPSALNDCREMNVVVLPPEINKSEFGFSTYNGQILFGLDSIKDTKGACVQRILDEREAKGEFLSFKSLLLKNVIDKSTCEAMIKAGAMDEFNKNRMALANYYSEVSDLVGSIAKKKKDIETISLELEENPKDEKIEKRLMTANNALNLLYEQLSVIRIVNCPEDHDQRMKNEKDVLGFFVSAHPMDSYREPESMGCVSIHDLSDNGKEVSIIGLIESVKNTVTKKDQKPMAVFQLEDKTGSIDVCCFPKSYAKCGEMIQEDAVVKMAGYVHSEEVISNSDDEDDEKVNIRLQFYVNRIETIKPDLSSIKIEVPSMLEWNDTLKRLKEKKLVCKEGHPLVILDKLTGEFRSTYCYIKEAVLLDKQFVTAISN